jgi:hypothetical protein
VDESWKLGRRRRESEVDESEVEETSGRAEGKRQRLQKLSGEIRIDPFPSRNL